MSDAPLQTRQEIIDQEHLRLLAIGYYIMGGISVAVSCFFLLYVFFGILIALSPEFLRSPRGGPNSLEAVFIGLMFAGIGGVLVLLGWTFGGLMIYSGRSIQKRRRRTLTLIMAALNCLSIPVGLLLGISTFVVLTRHSVSRLYDARSH